MTRTLLRPNRRPWLAASRAARVPRFPWMKAPSTVRPLSRAVKFVPYAAVVPTPTVPPAREGRDAVSAPGARRPKTKRDDAKAVRPDASRVSTESTLTP
jgi:hypothetical protein